MRHPLSARFHELLKEIGELHDKKQADYGKDEDPFANVRGSEEWGIKGWMGAMIRLNDKLRRLQAYAKKGTLENESVEDSFKDMAVYALIALCLWEQDQPKVSYEEAWDKITEVNPMVLGPKPRPEQDIPKRVEKIYPYVGPNNEVLLREPRTEPQAARREKIPIIGPGEWNYYNTTGDIGK